MASAIAKVTMFTTNSPVSRMFRSVSLGAGWPSTHLREGENPSNGGFAETALKKEKGARFRRPLLSVETHAIGRGTTAPMRPRARAASPPDRAQPLASARTASHGYTPEELARHLGLSNAKSLRGFLRRKFPRPAGDLWSRWGVLPPDVELAVRDHFGSRR